MRILGHIAIVLFLTALTQIGGLAWLATLSFRRKLVAFVLIYAGFCVGTAIVAPLTGRVALSCTQGGPLQVRSWVYCLTNRTYVTPELRDVATVLAAHMAAEYPGTVTLALDGNLPFFDGFPLLPHLSHDDGEKLDLAFYHRSGGDYLPGATRSPIEYFAFEPGLTDGPAVWPTMRWDLAWLQGVFPAYTPDRPRMQAALKWLIADARVGKVLVEPHLVQSLGLSARKLRFQGCRAARHDDHMHIQL